MALRKRFQLNKLVRDKFPEIMKSHDIHASYEFLMGAELEKSMKDKLVEEAEEVASAISIDEIKKELADVLRVIYSIADFYGFSSYEIEEQMRLGDEERGRFKKGIFANYIEMSVDNPFLSYFESVPNRYPEMKVCNKDE